MLPGHEYNQTKPSLRQCIEKGVDDMSIKHRYEINNDCCIHTPHAVVVTILQLI